jgi:hypothetical protein
MPGAVTRLGVGPEGEWEVSMRVHGGIAFTFAALSLLTAGRAAGGALLAYEGFDYAAVGSDVAGQAGGTGFSGPWAPGGFNASISDHLDVAAGSVPFGTLLTGGNRAASGPTNAIAGVTRPLATPLGADGTTRYFSVVLRPEGTLGAGAFNGFFGVTLETAGEPELYFGKPGDGAIGQYVVEDRGGAGQVNSGVPAAVGQAALLVLKAQFNAGNDVFTLYVNPTAGGAEPAAGAVKSDSNVGPVTGLTIYSTGAFSVDEIRVGDTFADVTPAVPEPVAGLSLVVGVAGAMLGRRAVRKTPRTRP